VSIVDGEPAGYGAAGIHSAPLVCELDHATGKSLSLRLFVPGLEVAQVLQFVGSVSEYGNIEHAKCRELENGYPYTPLNRQSKCTQTTPGAVLNFKKGRCDTARVAKPGLIVESKKVAPVAEKH
jgi:hypothetical protein